MKTTTKTTAMPPAERALAAWRTAQAHRDAATTAYREAFASAEKTRSPAQASPPDVRLALLGLDVEQLEAQDVEATERARAVWALDAEDVANGDQAAVACALEPLAADLEAGLAEIDKLRGAIAAEEDRIFARVHAARTGHAALASKRSAAGLPAPRRIPSADVGFVELVASLKATIAKGPIATSSNAEKVSRLRREETAERADIEKAHREEEATKARAKEHEEQQVRDREDRAKTDAAELAAARAKFSAKEAEEASLANAQKRRKASA